MSFSRLSEGLLRLYEGAVKDLFRLIYRRARCAALIFIFIFIFIFLFSIQAYIHRRACCTLLFGLLELLLALLKPRQLLNRALLET